MRGTSCIRATPHPSTFKIYQKDKPADPELHCDFIFVGDELRARVRDIRVDRQTQASDHQPVILSLGMSRITAVSDRRSVHVGQRSAYG